MEDVNLAPIHLFSALAWMYTRWAVGYNRLGMSNLIILLVVVKSTSIYVNPNQQLSFRQTPDRATWNILHNWHFRVSWEVWPEEVYGWWSLTSVNLICLAVMTEASGHSRQNRQTITHIITHIITQTITHIITLSHSSQHTHMHAFAFHTNTHTYCTRKQTCDMPNGHNGSKPDLHMDRVDKGPSQT